MRLCLSCTALPCPCGLHAADLRSHISETKIQPPRCLPLTLSKHNQHYLNQYSGSEISGGTISPHAPLPRDSNPSISLPIPLCLPTTAATTERYTTDANMNPSSSPAGGAKPPGWDILVAPTGTSQTCFHINYTPLSFDCTTAQHTALQRHV